MDSLAITVERAGVAKITIKRLSGEGKEGFCWQNALFCEDAIMKGCDLREGLFASLVFLS